MSLREYERKRRFGDTPEPGSDARSRTPRTKQPIFVVQLHHARARHYDFRLEVDGALKSWAVPKGPSLRAGEKRLAVEVEDHPLAYADFSGDIPAGNYGAGHVDLFDRGTWVPDGEPMPALARGRLDFELDGDRLRGRWSLIRTRKQGGRNQWLLIKRNDAHAQDSDADALVAAGASATADTQRSAGRKRDAGSKRPSRSKAAATWRARALALEGAREPALAAGFRPQLCVLQEAPPDGDEWLHETKWDGYRMLVDLVAGRAQLRSRNDLDWSARFPAIARALEALPVADARLDGELIALDARGHGDFSALQRALESGAQASLRYVLFDLPGLAGVDLRAVALEQRKALLESLLRESPDPLLAFSTHVRGNGERVFAAATRQGLEGVVSKAVDAPYEHGRSRSWLKTKHAQSDEFVVVGYTEPKGAREGFGSLLLARKDGTALRYVGRVGSGFTDNDIATLTRRLAALRTQVAVLSLPAHVPFRAASVHWVEPRLVIEAAFRGWAKEGLLRQASFLRTRPDKKPEDTTMANRENHQARAEACA